MKNTTVNVQLQLDVTNGDLKEIMDAIDVINKALQDANLNCQPQILTEAIDDDDIGEVMDFGNDDTKDDDEWSKADSVYS